ncbi:MAG: DNA-binding domain-containing protein [Xanthobacteraceae bacterium]
MASDQATFTRALLDPGFPVPPGVTSHTHAAPVKRFAVYRNNIVVGLVDALALRFPATRRIVGEEFFRAMARLFARAHPPCSPLMMQYGDDLPDFIAGFAPAAELPYLADVARLEAARTRAFHAADATALGPQDFAAIPPDALAALQMRLCPGVAILRSPHPVVTIWAMNADGGEPAPIEDWVAEDALVSREGFAVAVRRLPPGGAGFVEHLRNGSTLGEAAAAAMAETDQFDLTANLAGLIGSGLVAGYVDGKEISS